VQEIVKIDDIHLQKIVRHHQNRQASRENHITKNTSRAHAMNLKVHHLRVRHVVILKLKPSATHTTIDTSRNHVLIPARPLRAQRRRNIVLDATKNIVVIVHLLPLAAPLLLLVAAHLVRRQVVVLRPVPRQVVVAAHRVVRHQVVAVAHRVARLHQAVHRVVVPPVAVPRVARLHQVVPLAPAPAPALVHLAK
jgi:hypothetical protein